MSGIFSLKQRIGDLLGAQRRLPPPDYSGFPHKHLLGIEELEASDIQRILDCAEHYIARNQQQDKKHAILKGRTLINLFFESSTRTRTSFEIAGKRLGMDVVNISIAASSVSKGETLLDTARSLAAMHADAIVVRHAESGVAHMLAHHVQGAVINGGDGAHEHPTQALLDALTIRFHKGRLDGVRVALCGDILHSRVARSNILLLKKMGASVVMVAPSTLLPATPQSFGVDIARSMREGLDGADVVMMLRVQHERMEGKFVPSVREYFARFGLDRTRLAYAKPDALVMHPGPINRGVEIDGDLADDVERSVILQQVELGVAVRQAVLELLV
ncbi:MAG: aspartate carbamoyltransferase catalytic subunit [Alphaproteobacteria bacterium]|nr:MAG: aspartate carbamoyltransferase catalytic subunit [Alphaproteobacteria bacterium]TAF76697.1 MAG: aspartate carbamoyltransferase catalytic subunit [Alphaproteobacteria bacterium]